MRKADYELLLRVLAKFKTLYTVPTFWPRSVTLLISPALKDNVEKPSDN
jgi:hypothetical protein